MPAAHALHSRKTRGSYEVTTRSPDEENQGADWPPWASATGKHQRRKSGSGKRIRPSILHRRRPRMPAAPSASGDYSRQGRHTSHKAGSRSVAQKEAGSKYADKSMPASRKVGGSICTRGQGSDGSRPRGVVASRSPRRRPSRSTARRRVPESSRRHPALPGTARPRRSRTRERCVSMASVQSCRWRGDMSPKGGSRASA